MWAENKWVGSNSIFYRWLASENRAVNKSFLSNRNVIKDTNKVRKWAMQTSRYRAFQAKGKQIKRPWGRSKLGMFRKAWMVGLKWARGECQEVEVSNDSPRARSYLVRGKELALYSRWDGNPLEGCWAKEDVLSTYIWNLNSGFYLENGLERGKGVRKETP